MATTVVQGATCRCMFGAGSGTLVISEDTPSIAGKKIATTKDIRIEPMGAPFLTCCALNNPTVMAVGSPGPCTFVPKGIWESTESITQINGFPVLNSSCTLTCASYGGTVIIQDPGQQTTQSK